jgi:hypothetical protein
MAYLASIAAHDLASSVHGTVAAASSAAADWAWGTLGSVLFVAVVAIPAALLNNRERRQRRS